MLLSDKLTYFTTSLVINILLIKFCETFDDELDVNHHQTSAPVANLPLPKDKVLLSGVKSLIFYRNKRTTSRRTHSIHQLSCVGGTAGCRLFKPDVVECENLGFDKSTSRFNWKCHSEVSDDVTFNHVEVICEGYDYPEDEYILVGSCGLEFTLDYKDPRNHHKKSYFEHMDEHEKALHKKKLDESKPKQTKNLLQNLVEFVTDHLFITVGFIALVLVSLLVASCLSGNERDQSNKKKSSRTSSYGPLTSAVMTTKKAC